jgi:hypothetical protein
MEEKGKQVLLVDRIHRVPTFCWAGSRQAAVSIHEVLLGEVEPDAALVDPEDDAAPPTSTWRAPRRCC